MTKCAAECGVRERMWKSWEAGVPPAATKLRVIARILGVGLDDLFVAVPA